MMVRVAIRNVFRYRLRTTFTVLGLSIAVALLADMLMLSSGMDKTFYRVLESLGYEIRVCPAGTLPFSSEAVIANSSSVSAAIAEDARVERQLRVLGSTVFTARNRDGTATDAAEDVPGAGRGGPSAGDIPLFAIGIDGKDQTLYRVIDGTGMEDAAMPAGMVPLAITQRTADAIGATVGDTISISASSQGAAAPVSARLECIVTAIAGVEFDLEQQHTVVMPLSALQRLRPTPADAASFVLVKLAGAGADDFAPIEAQRSVARDLEAQFPALDVYAIDELFEALARTLAYFKQFALILASISVVIAFLLIGVVLTIGVNERRGEIAALRSIGFRPFSIRTMVLVESIVLIAMGSAVGSVLGWFLAGYLDRILTASPGLPAGYSFFIAAPADVATAVAIAAAVGVLAALYPAIHATRIDLPQTLHEDVV